MLDSYHEFPWSQLGEIQGYPYSWHMVKNCSVDASLSSGEIMIADLSSRELAILGLIADGWSNRAIEQQLSIGSKTLEAACRSIYRKLHLDDTPEVNRRVLATRAIYVRSRTCIDHDFDIPDVRFIGRRQELEELDLAVQTKRLVTVTGSGGMGRRHLHLHLHSRAGEQRSDAASSSSISSRLPVAPR